MVSIACDIIQPTSGRKGFCWRCEAALPPRRRKWCSEDCAELYWRNHSWSYTREAAIRRDNWRCRICGYGQDFIRTGLEVNHIVPLEGIGYGDGCHNHLDNLETLCHGCHVIVTTRQGRMRKAGSLQPPLILEPIATGPRLIMFRRFIIGIPGGRRGVEHADVHHLRH